MSETYDAILRAWERDDLYAATDLLEEVSEPFRKTWEYRFVRDLCRRRGFQRSGSLGAVQSGDAGAGGYCFLHA